MQNLQSIFLSCYSGKLKLSIDEFIIDPTRFGMQLQESDKTFFKKLAKFYPERPFEFISLHVFLTKSNFSMNFISEREQWAFASSIFLQKLILNPKLWEKWPFIVELGYKNGRCGLVGMKPQEVCLLWKMSTHGTWVGSLLQAHGAWHSGEANI